MDERITTVDGITRWCYVHFLEGFCPGRFGPRILSGWIRSGRFGPRDLSGVSVIPDNILFRGIVLGNYALAKSGELCLRNIMSEEIVSEGITIQGYFIVDLTVLSSFPNAISNDTK